MLTKFIAGAVVVCAVGLPSAFAAEPVADIHASLEEVVVTAHPSGASEGHLAQPVIVLQGEELRKKVSATLGETLSREAGVSSSAFGAGASRPVIRGMSGSRVRLLESGISSMDVSNLSPDHAVGIEPLAATQIEIIKGPATLLYGSGALGGVVNVVTNRIAYALPSDFSAQAQVSYGTVADERSGAFTADGALGQLALHVDGSARDTHDYSIPGFATTDPIAGVRSGTLNSSDLETQSMTGGASYIGSRGYLGFDISHFASAYGVPGEGARIDLNQLRYDIKGQLEVPLKHIDKLKIQLGHVDYEHSEFESDGALGTTFNNDEYDGRFEILHQPIANWAGTLGLQIGHRDFEADGDEALTPPLVSHTESLFLVEERDLGHWHLEFGGRIEQQHVDPTDSTSGTYHFAYSVSGGVVANFDDNYSLGVYLSRAQRAPSLEELYNNGPHEATSTFELGSRQLSEESANNIDITWRASGNAWPWQINLYANYIEDFIFTENVDTNGDGVADRVDDAGLATRDIDSLLLIHYAQHDAVFYGIEATASKHLIQAPWGDMDLRASLDYVRAELSNGDNLPRITPLRVGAGLDFHRARWMASLDVFRVARQQDNAELETETAGYTLVSAHLSYTLPLESADYVMSLRADNLLDEQARAHTSFLKDSAPLPGRSVMLSFRVRY